MEYSNSAVKVAGTQVKKGDNFTFVVIIDGKHKQLTGTVRATISSKKARALGLTKSKRRRLYLGLEVEGYERLFWKDKGQVKALKYGVKADVIAKGVNDPIPAVIKTVQPDLQRERN